MPTRTCPYCLRFLLAVACGWSFVVAALSADTTRQDPLYTLQIERQPLEQGLQEFARQSGVQLVFFSQIAEGRDAPALRGQYSLAGALEALLAGSDLTFRIVNRSTVQIERRAADPRRAKGPDVSATSSRSARADAAFDLEQVTVTASASGLTATRVETPLREIPQTFSIISAEQLRQQNLTTPQEALEKAPGIVSTRESSIDRTFFSRGYRVSTLHIDGSSTLNAQRIATVPVFASPDLSEFERVELLRGADALFGADSEPGGTVNLIRKRPLKSFAASVSGWAGSWNDYRVEADVTGPIPSSDRVRGRLVGLYSDRDYFFDIATLQRKKIFGVLEADVTDSILLTVGGSYQWDRAVPYFTGLPTYVDGRDPHLARRRALGFDWARYDVDAREVYMNLEQSLGSSWKLRIGATALDGKLQFTYPQLYAPIDSETDALLGVAQATQSAEPNIQRQLAIDVTLRGDLELFGRRAEVAMGADLSRLHVTLAERLLGAFGPVGENVRNFDPAHFPNPLPLLNVDIVLYQHQHAHFTGVFAALRVHATDALSAVGGVRVSNGHYPNHAEAYIDGVFVSRLGGNGRDREKFTPYAGAVYELNPVYSIYASYADIYQTAAFANTLQGVTLRPADGVVWEGGIKSAWRGGALTGALAVYRIKQSGLPVAIPGPRPPGRDSRCCFTPSGVTRSKGLDMELNGRLAQRWLIGASYSYNVNRDVDDTPLIGQTPRHLIKLWTSTKLPEALSRWEIGGTLHAQSATSASGRQSEGPFTIRQPSYLTLDLRAGFDLNTHWGAALTIGNVFDKRYYETIDQPASGNWYGEPRSVRLRLDGRF